MAGILFEFILRHWVLVALTLVVVVWLILEEGNFIKDQQRLSCTQLVDLMNHHPVKLLDLRSKENFDKGHIRGSINFLSKTLKLELNPSVKVVLINQRGEQLSSYLKQNREVRYLHGGIEAWLQARLPLEK